MKVADLMTKNVQSIREDAPLSAAAQMMWDCDCGAIPVLDSQGSQVIGMVTDRDICMATWSRDAAPSAVRVSDAMSKSLYHCSPDDSVASAETIMRQRQVRRVPVLGSDRRLVGILSLADVVRNASSSSSRGQRESAEEITSTLATICKSSNQSRSGARAS